VPFNILVAPGGKVLWSSKGEVDPTDLRRRIVGHLGRFYKPN